MIDLETLPKWVQENVTAEEGSVEFNGLAKVKFFLLDKQVTPYGTFEFPDGVIDSLLVAGDDSMVVYGFLLQPSSKPNRFMVTTNSNIEYDVKYLTSGLILKPEIDGDDITLTMADGKTTPGGDLITKIVISPLSTDELNVVIANGER